MITRDNYEEFFLLYIDNELSVADREAVEQFVAHHPDLQQEWQALLHCRQLPEEEIVFPDREALYRTGVEEDDDEFLHFSPDLSIVFPDKASLYKQEEDKRIVWLPWLRIGAAAAIIGIVALLVLLSGRHTPAPSVALPIAKNNKNVPPVTPAATGTLYSGGGGAARPAANKPMKEKRKGKTSGQDIREEVEPVGQDLAQQAQSHDPVHDPAPARPTDITATRAADITATRAAVTTANVRSGDAVAALQRGIPREESSFATQALQQENENHDPENNILVSAESPVPGKGKLRGLFRKVTRTFGKTADRDDDGQRKVLVGAFQIALK
jgi:cytoskeletal protein RodZ